MRSWRRAPSDTLCGLCGATIQQDDPALYIQLPNVKRERTRCASCEGPAPPGLPANLVAGGITPTHIGFSRAAAHGPGRTRGQMRAYVEKFSPHNS